MTELAASDYRLSRIPWKPALFALLLTVGITAIPLIFIRLVTGSFIPDVLPSLQPDSDYYAALIREVLDGNIWLGNPYLWEYAHLHSPSIYLPVWVAAVPGFFGLPIQHLLLFNVLLYSIATGMLLFVFLLRITENKAWLSSLLTGIGVAYVHNWLVRAVIMQTVFPLFLLFLIVLHLFIEQRKTAWIVCMGLLAAIAFHFYLYLWMILFSALGLLTLFCLWNRQWRDVRRLCVMWVSILLLITPEALRIHGALSDPVFLEVAARLGVVRTRLVTLPTFLNAKYLILSLIGIVAVHRLGKMRWSTATITLIIAILAILITTFSNILSGKDVSLVTHAWRFGLLMTVAAAAWFLSHFKGTKAVRGIGTVCVVLLLLTMTSHIAIRANAFTYLYESEARVDLQYLAVPFDILNTLPEGVVLANEELSCRIPIYTKHSVIFCGSAYYHPVPTRELLERYLLQHLPTADADVVREASLAVAGIGPDLRANDANLRNRLCRRTGLCEDDGHDYTAFEMIGGQAAQDEAMPMLRELSAHTDAAMKRFGVTYVVIDRMTKDNPAQPVQSKTLFEDDRWLIVEL